MREVENIQSLLTLKPDFIGFIFYKKSKRYVVDFPQVNFPKGIKKVGVFVNENIEVILGKVNQYQLNVVQLHGNETPEYCYNLKLNNGHLERSRKIVSESQSIEIIKAFSVDKNFSFNLTKPYENSCDYFLFDTKGINYGGNGIKFNWEILQNYRGKVPFLLSGGVTKNDVESIRKIDHPAFEGVDINSGFEIQPGLKNIQEIKEFKNMLI